MPRYDFACPDCEHVEEFFRRADDRDDPQECPACQGAMARQFSAPRMVAKKRAETLVESQQRLLGIGKDEKFFDNPWNGEYIRLKGSKAEMRRQVVQSLQRANVKGSHDESKIEIHGI